MERPKTAFSEDKAAFRRLAARVADIAAEHLETVENRPVDRTMPESARRLLMEQRLSEDGESAEHVIEFLREHVVPWPLPTGHPRSYGWINSPPAPIGVLADTLSSTLNATSDGFDHAGIFLLACVSRWLMTLTGFPVEGSMGLLLSGGSAANLNALAVARFRAARRAGWDVRRDGLSGAPAMTVYASDQAHSSIQKCVEMLGIGAVNLRLIATDENYRLRPEALKRAIEDDVSRAAIPCCVVANAGATNTGAIDPLVDVATVCEANGVWFHIDGAYGALGRLDPAYAERYRGVERADSLTVNPHKWLMTPIDCGALLVRDMATQREAFSLVPAYLDAGDPHAAPWPYEYSFQLTYADRAIKTWAILARLGRNGVRELVVRHNALATSLGREIESADDLALVAPVSLSVVCFRYRPHDRGFDDATVDRLNERISRAISESGEAHVPTTKVDGRSVLRACFMHYENDEADVRHLIALVRKLGEGLAKEMVSH